MVASAYGYDTQTHFFEVGEPPSLAQEVMTHDMRYGIQRECEFMIREVEDEVAVHEYITTEHKASNVLELSYEALMSDFDDTTRSIYQHYLGSSHPKVEQLVTMARKDDLTHMSPEEFQKMALWQRKHVSDKGIKVAVKDVMRQLLEANDPCMLRLKELNERMGYSGFP